MKVLLIHYTHPEGYPPTLNAINNLSKHFEKVVVLSKDTMPTRWNYDGNVKLVLQDEFHDRLKQVAKSKLDKIKSYISYLSKFRKLLLQEKFELLILYDALPLLFFVLIKPTIKKSHQPKIWYHNHDVYSLDYYKKFSINWFAALVEQKKLKIVNFFSLPAIERKDIYPLSYFKGKFFFIPNYPSINFFKLPDTPKKTNSSIIKIIYPGGPSDKNGFEELLSIMSKKINNKLIHLTLLGDIHANYKYELIELKKKFGVEDQLFFEDRISYTEMGEYLKQFHIGWAVYKPIGLSYTTAGTASNKIYEFMANCLPILVIDNSHHRKYLEKCKAVFFTTLTKESISNQIESIDADFEQLSLIARNEFETNYYFEKEFEKVVKEVINDIKIK